MNRKIEIRKWFLDQGLTERQIAREAGVSFQLVWMVLEGSRRNALVLSALAAHGFPAELLPEAEEKSSERKEK
jgi:transcriptional regulator with XRE-family HTH domain